MKGPSSGYKYDRVEESRAAGCLSRVRGWVEGLSPRPFQTVYPKTTVQLCIVHMVRASLSYVNWQERKQVAADLKAIYRAATVEQAEQELTALAARWDKQGHFSVPVKAGFYDVCVMADAFSPQCQKVFVERENVAPRIKLKADLEVMKRLGDDLSVSSVITNTVTSNAGCH